MNVELARIFGPCDGCAQFRKVRLIRITPPNVFGLQICIPCTKLLREKLDTLLQSLPEDP